MTIKKVQKQIESLYNNNLLTEEIKKSLVNTLQKGFYLMELINFDKENCKGKNIEWYKECSKDKLEKLYNQLQKYLQVKSELEY